MNSFVFSVVGIFSTVLLHSILNAPELYKQANDTPIVSGVDVVLALLLWSSNHGNGPRG